MDFHGKDVVFDGVEKHPETKDVQDIFSKIVSGDLSITKETVLKFEYKSEPLGVSVTLVKVGKEKSKYFVEIDGEKLEFSTCYNVRELEGKVQKHFMDEFLKMVCREYFSVRDMVIINSEAQWCVALFKRTVYQEEGVVI